MSSFKEILDQISRSEMKVQGLDRVQRGLLWILAGSLGAGVIWKLEWMVWIVLLEVIAIEAVATLIGLEE